MSLVVNGRFLARPVTGVERYAKEILSRLMQHMPGQLRLVPPPAWSHGWRGHFWEQLILPRHLRTKELLWSPANTGPAMVSSQVLTLHDISPLEHPEWFAPAFASWYKLFLPLLVRQARCIMVPSYYVQRKITSFFKLPSGRVIVVPGGVDEEVFYPSDSQPLDLPASYVLFVGSIQARKNLARLFLAWQLVQSAVPDTWLLVAGAGSQVFRPPTLPEIQRVKFLGFVPDNFLPGLYANAALFILPSLDEGFGLPVLEAMACGVPVAAANAGALPEVVGDAGLIFDPLDIPAIASALNRGLVDRALRHTLRQRGFSRTQNFSWHASAEMMRKVIEECR